MGITNWLFGSKKKSVLMGQPRFTKIGGKVVPVGDDLESNITEGYEAIGTIYSIIRIMTNKAGSIPG